MLKTLLVTLTRHAKASVQKNKRGEEVTEAAIAMLLIIELYLKMPAGINKSNNELIIESNSKSTFESDFNSSFYLGSHYKHIANFESNLNPNWRPPGST